MCVLGVGRCLGASGWRGPCRSTASPAPEALRRPLQQCRGVPGAAVQHGERPVRPHLVQGDGGPAAEGESPPPPPTLRKHRLPACARPCRSRRALCHLAVAGPVRALAVSRMPCARHQLNPMTRHHPISQMPKLRRRPPCHTCRGEGVCRLWPPLPRPSARHGWPLPAASSRAHPPGAHEKDPRPPLAPPTG